MLFGFLLVLLILIALALAAAVLLQAGQGGGLASLGASGGTSADTIFGNRTATTILTKATWWLGGALLALSLVLSLVRRDGGNGSALQEQLRQADTPAPAAAVPLGAPPAEGAAPVVPAPAPATTTP